MRVSSRDEIFLFESRDQSRLVEIGQFFVSMNSIEGRAFTVRANSSDRLLNPFFVVEHDQVTHYGRVIAGKNSTTSNSAKAFHAIAFRVRDTQLRSLFQQIGTDRFVDQDYTI